LAGAVAGC